MKKIKATIIQTVAPDYRKRIFDFLSKETAIDFKLYTGDLYFEPSVKTAINEKYCVSIKNIYFFNRFFLFQFGIWAAVFKSDVLVIELNPRIISNWLILIIRKSLYKKTVVWGHAWPRNGANNKSDKVRNLMRLLADEIIVYTNQQSIELNQKMPRKKIRFAPNALYFKKEMKVSDTFNNADCDNIVYVGRLTKLKKAFFLVKAFHIALSDFPKSTNLIIVGEGEEKSAIKNYIETHRLEERVSLLGHVSEFDKLKQIYSKSLISVSPGYVGLSITQSLGFGVPMLISRNENHSPELEAAIDYNSLFFETDKLNSLSQKLIQIFRDKSHWMSKRDKISRDCSNTYSIEKMAQTFIESFKDN